MAKPTSRARFERWAKRDNKFDVSRMQEVTRNGPRWFYTSTQTALAWTAWEAARRAFT